MNNTKLVIPSCNDFMSIYGFDCEMDDVIQILKFEHGDEKVNLNKATLRAEKMSKNTKSKIRDIRKYNAKTEVKLVYFK